MIPSDEDSSEDERESRMESLSPTDRFLFHSVYRNDAAAVQRALQQDANVNCVREKHDKRLTGTHTTPLFEACRHGYDEIVRILLNAGADAYWRKDICNYSAIEKVCDDGRFLSIVEVLLNHDKNLLEIGRRTPLILAIHNEHFDFVRFLLDRGANVNAATQDSYGRTALMHACGRSDFATVQLLLAANVDVEARNGNQQTALHQAVLMTAGHDILQELILQGNANIFVVDRHGKTPFDFIRCRTLDPAVDQLLGIYSNKMTHDHGRLALHAILGAAEYALVEDEKFHPPLKPLLQLRLPLGMLTLKHFRTLLSTFDTNLIRNRDENRKLPVHTACRSNAPVEVLSMLVDLDSTTLQIADHSGNLPLHECCCGVVDDSSVRYLLEQGGVGTLAARTRDGALPLHLLCASANPSLRTVQYVIQSFPGAVTARTNAGHYPFMIAACESSTASLSVVYELIRAYPDLIILNF